MKILLAAVNSKYVHTNLAVRYIKSYCSGFDINIKEYTINDHINNVISDIYSQKPDVIGFSCYIWNIEMVLKLCSSLKKVSPEMVVVLGGPEVSYDSEELMENQRYIDYVVKGEGEEASKQLFEYLEGRVSDIHRVLGLVYREGGRIVNNGECPAISGLDCIPFPYGQEPDGLKNRILYYESSRGCPFNCSYCLSSTIRGVRFLALERVKKDLMWFIDNEISLVKFVDRTFNCGRYYLDILRFLVENRRKTKFHFEISAGMLDKGAIEFMNSIPEDLFQFEIGVQSTNEHTLDIINRRSSTQNLFDNIMSLRQKNNMHIHLDLIAGLPGEDYDSFIRSFNDVFTLKPHMMQLGFLKLLKGSNLRENADKYGIVYTEYPPYEILKTEQLSYDEMALLRNIEDVVDRYYNSGRFRASLAFILEKIHNPFKMFEKITQFLVGKGKNNTKMSSADQYRMLYDFFNHTFSEDDNIMKEVLAFDYLRQGRNPVVPSFLSGEGEVSKGFIWDFLSDEKNVETYLPHYSQKGKKNIIRNLYLRRFHYDICEYIAGGRIKPVENIIVFDYDKKSSRDQVYCFSIPV